MQRPGRGSQETIVQPWGRVLVPPQGVHRTRSFEFSCRTKTLTKWKVYYLMKPSSFQKGGPPDLVLRPLNTNFEECKLTSTVILIRGPIFHSANYKATSYCLPREGTVFKALACCDLPLPGRAINAIFFSFTSKLSLCFYSALVDRGCVSATPSHDVVTHSTDFQSSLNDWMDGCY